MLFKTTTFNRLNIFSKNLLELFNIANIIPLILGQLSPGVNALQLSPWSMIGAVLVPAEDTEKATRPEQHMLPTPRSPNHYI